MMTRGDTDLSYRQVLDRREFCYHLPVSPQIASWMVSGAGAAPRLLWRTDRVAVILQSSMMIWGFVQRI